MLPRVAVLSALLALALAAPARADLTWNPQTLSVAGSAGDFARVAANGKGDAIAVWRIKSGNNSRIEASFRSAGGNFGSANVVVDVFAFPAGYTVFAPRAAIDAQGDAVVVWYQGVPSPGNARSYSLQYSYRPAGGSFAAPQNITTGDLRAPEVVMDAAGNATVLWRQNTGASPRRDEARVAKKAAGSGTFGGFTTISNNSSSSPPGENVFVRPEGDTEEEEISRVSLTMDPSGRTLAVWSSFINGTQYVRAAYRATATGSFDPPVTVAQSQAYDPTAAFDSQGNAIVVWTGGYAIRSASTGFAAPQPMPVNGWPRAAFDAQGGVVVVGKSDGNVAQWSYRPAGGSFGPAVDLSPPGETGYDPQVGTDSSGNATAVWFAAKGSDQMVDTAYRPAGAGTAFGPAHSLSDPGDLPERFYGDFPHVAVGANGEAFAVWSRNDGTAFRVQSSIGLPPGAPPLPPPPPPPEPPVPSAIQPAEAFKRSQAIVLTVNVTGQADRVRWTFGGKAPPVVGEVVSGGLQRSVRVHPEPGSSFTATATVSGPGGTKSFSRTFSILRGLADPDVSRIENAVDRFSKVDTSAAGFADNLLGKTSACSPMTVVAGQQKLSGCLKPIEDLPDIPSAERGILAPLAQELRLNLNDSELMKKAVEFSDGYIAQGRALLNDQWPVVPSGAAKLLSYPQASALTSSNASIEVAGVKFGASPKGFSLDWDPKKTNIPLGSLPHPPKFPSIGGFELVGDWNMDLGKQEAIIKASLKLPKWLTSAGVEIQNSVTLRATPTELKVEDVSIGPIKVNLGGLDVKDFKIAYTKAEDTWQGQGKACLATGLCLDMVPPNGQVKITHGQLNFAGASVNFPPPGVPLFTGVNLERLGFGFGLDPTRMTGNGLIAVGKIAKLDGRLVVAFPSDRTPFVLRADEVGGGFPAQLYGTKFTRPTIGATAAVIVDLPVLGNLTLGGGYFLFQSPVYVALGGGVDFRILKTIRIYGAISGEANFRDEVVNLHGDIGACVNLVKDVCATAVANVSRGPNSAGGAGACVGVAGIHIGGGIQWAHPTKPKVWPFDGCKWSPFKLDVRATRAQAAGTTIVVKRGQPNPAVKLYGQGAAPRVHVAGPGGQALDSTDNGLDLSPGGKIRILRYEGDEDFTVVGLQNAAARHLPR